MAKNEETWQAHEQYAKKTLDEARVLFDAGFYDGASKLALSSCLQVAKAASIRLAQKGDREDWRQRLVIMFKDGRLQPDFHENLFTVFRANEEERFSTVERDESWASAAIGIAEKIQHCLMVGASITESLRSPKVRAAMAARGMTM